MFPSLFPEEAILTKKAKAAADHTEAQITTKKSKAAAGHSVDIEEHEPHQTEAHVTTKKKGKTFQPIESTIFSVAFSGTEARLYVSWKHGGLKYYMAGVQSFLLHRPDHYLEFHKYVLNIIDWGKGKRLQSFRDALDILIKERNTRLQTQIVGEETQTIVGEEARVVGEETQTVVGEETRVMGEETQIMGEGNKGSAKSRRHPPPPLPLDNIGRAQKKPRLMGVIISSPMTTLSSLAMPISSPVTVTSP